MGLRAPVLPCRLAQLAGMEHAALQSSNFRSTGDISAHASGVRVLVLRVLKAAVSLTKAKAAKQKDQVAHAAFFFAPHFDACICNTRLLLYIKLFHVHCKPIN